MSQYEVGEKELIIHCYTIEVHHCLVYWWVSLSVLHIELSGGQPQHVSTIML